MNDWKQKQMEIIKWLEDFNLSREENFTMQMEFIHAFSMLDYFLTRAKEKK
jgi:hypothetical protein